VYVVPEDSPVSEYVVAVPVLDTRDQVEPPLYDLSILYPVIGEPPLFEGALHERLICDEEAVAAASPVGGCGVLPAVAVALFDGELVPIELTA
jgi:hypothetical protein